MFNASDGLISIDFPGLSTLYYNDIYKIQGLFYVDRKKTLGGLNVFSIPLVSGAFYPIFGDKMLLASLRCFLRYIFFCVNRGAG